jgi:hypothetical protein
MDNGGHAELLPAVQDALHGVGDLTNETTSVGSRQRIVDEVGKYATQDTKNDIATVDPGHFLFGEFLAAFTDLIHSSSPPFPRLAHRCAARFIVAVELLVTL